MVIYWGISARATLLVTIKYNNRAIALIRILDIIEKTHRICHSFYATRYQQYFFISNNMLIQNLYPQAVPSRTIWRDL